MIRFFTFSQFHNKNPVAGSTFIRVEQLIKYWKEAGLYTFGENPEALIFQKIYCSEDYKFPAHFKGIKILDICDPDWFDGAPIKETIDAVDAIVTSTQNLADFIRQMTDKPIRVIPDRFDLELVPKPRTHHSEATTVTWFGYSHNAELLKPAINSIQKLNLKLLVIANEDPGWKFHLKKDKYEFVKYNEETFYQDVQKADFAILPSGSRPQDRFKSNNKTVKAILAGLPVATNLEELESFMDARNRNSFMLKNYGIIRAEYDVKKSVEEYKMLIGELK